MIIIFLGPPYSGKGTQARLLGEQLSLPVFSMGELIRKAYEKGDPKAIEGHDKYSMKGLHLPNSLKFYLLEEQIDKNKDGFILDNYPATSEDLETILDYMKKNNLKIDRVIYIPISVDEMKNRMIHRNRRDDNPEIVFKRREEQDKNRIPVLEYFKSEGILVEVNGEDDIKTVQENIRKAIS